MEETSPDPDHFGCQYYASSLKQERKQKENTQDQPLSVQNWLDSLNKLSEEKLERVSMKKGSE